MPRNESCCNTRCYQPSCHTCFYLIIIFRTVATKTLFQHCKLKNFPHIITINVTLVRQSYVMHFFWETHIGSITYQNTAWEPMALPPAVLPLFPTWQFFQPHFWAHLLQVLIFQLLKSCLSALWQLMAVTVTTRLNGDPCAEAWTVEFQSMKSFVTSSWMLHTYSDTWQPNSLIYRMYQKSICQHNDIQVLNNDNFLFICGRL
jgi:hypothetical protein